MSSFDLVIALTAFLSGAASAVFVMIVVGIRKGDRPRHRRGAGDASLETFTRTVLGTRTWPNVSVAFDDREEE